MLALRRPVRKRASVRTEIGWCELVDLPGLKLKDIHAKMDTGAATSSIHATRVRPFERDGRPWVEFWFRPFPGEKARRFEAPSMGQRLVRSSNGERQARHVIETQICLGNLCWTSQLTLANRASMAFPILIGRRALRLGLLLVDSRRKWVLGRPASSETL
ncbi:MAG: ATP-dependent zinc protease family protein [Sphingorhabdus sp.]